MARQQRKIEGDENQRRKAARDAREQGRRPSETGSTLGASKQRKETRRGASHSERLEQRGEGKRGSATRDKPRPGSRERDPKRGSRWE